VIALITFRLALNNRDFHSEYIFYNEYKIRQHDQVYAWLFSSAGSYSFLELWNAIIFR